jgi:hypothetical protein
MAFLLTHGIVWAAIAIALISVDEDGWAADARMTWRWRALRFFTWACPRVSRRLVDILLVMDSRESGPGFRASLA